jgi:hypothetical protein
MFDGIPKGPHPESVPRSRLDRKFWPLAVQRKGAIVHSTGFIDFRVSRPPGHPEEGQPVKDVIAEERRLSFGWERAPEALPLEQTPRAVPNRG